MVKLLQNLWQFPMLKSSCCLLLRVVCFFVAFCSEANNCSWSLVVYCHLYMKEVVLLESWKDNMVINLQRHVREKSSEIRTYIYVRACVCMCVCAQRKANTYYTWNYIKLGRQRDSSKKAKKAYQKIWKCVSRIITFVSRVERGP